MNKFVPYKLIRRQVVSKRASVFDLMGKIPPIMAKLKLFETEVISYIQSLEEPISEHLRVRTLSFWRKIPADAVSDQARLILVLDATEKVLMFNV